MQRYRRAIAPVVAASLAYYGSMFACCAVVCSGGGTRWCVVEASRRKFRRSAPARGLVGPSLLASPSLSIEGPELQCLVASLSRRHAFPKKRVPGCPSSAS
jgi:hypothetical protein